MIYTKQTWRMVVVVCITVFFVGLFFLGASAETPMERRSKLEEQIANLEKEAAVLDAELTKTKGETQTLKGEIQRLTNDIKKRELEIKKINNDIVYIKVCGNHGRTTLCKYNKTGNEISIKSYIVDMKSIEFFYKYMDDLHIIYAGEVLYCTINAEKLTAGEIAEIHNYIYKMNPIKTALQYFN